MTVPGSQADVARFLSGQAGGPPLETHISALFRGADTVWKLKKAVRLGFLDFTALPERERLLRRELELNAPLAPRLYRGVRAVTREGGTFALDGAGAPVDWVLEMAPVAEADFADAMAEAGRIGPAQLRDLADAVAAMHAGQAPVPAPDPVARLRDVAVGNARAARDAGLPEHEVAAWEGSVLAAIEGAAPALRRRAALHRRAHGDLHLGNVLLWGGRLVPFDALEFDEDLATIDPGYDLAFLLMDVERLLGRPAANALLNRYVARTGDAGLAAVLPPFLSLRALIRAHVRAASGHEAGPLLRTAREVLRPAPAMALAVGGLMGTGKSTLARALAPELGPAPGALVLRSDEVRKRLHGAAPEDRLAAEAYTPEAHARTERALLDALAAAAPHAVILDATFLDPAAAARAEAAARRAGLPFLGVWLEAPLAELERRVAARRDDASDADAAVLRWAAAAARVPDGWRRVDATDAEAARRTVQTALDMVR